MSLLHDEKGQWSSARCALWFVLFVIAYLAVRGPERAADVWQSLTEICLGLIGWAGGSRVMQYVASMRRSSGRTPDSTGITPGE